jgi:hypothetical protein
MAANTNPIFCKAPRAAFANVGTVAVTGTDGTDANVKTVFTADATNGSRIDTVYVQHLGTNGTASTLRFFINNGSSAAVAANNSLVHEETLAASTISQTAASVGMIWQANLVLPAGYKLMVAAGTALAGDAKVTAIGGDY